MCVVSVESVLAGAMFGGGGGWVGCGRCDGEALLLVAGSVVYAG